MPAFSSWSSKILPGLMSDRTNESPKAPPECREPLFLCERARQPSFSSFAANGDSLFSHGNLVDLPRVGVKLNRPQTRSVDPARTTEGRAHLATRHRAESPLEGHL